MSQKKKQIRAAFRDAVYKRDMPNGGYVKENGVSLCKAGNNCHLKAEEFHSTGTAAPGFSPEELYAKVGSTYEKAYEASLRLE